MLNIAVLTPMPRPREMIAIAVNPGLRPSAGRRGGDLVRCDRATPTPGSRLDSLRVVMLPSGVGQHSLLHPPASLLQISRPAFRDDAASLLELAIELAALKAYRQHRRFRGSIHDLCPFMRARSLVRWLARRGDTPTIQHRAAHGLPE